jgi:hypothetical protein
VLPKGLPCGREKEVVREEMGQLWRFKKKLES